MLRDAGFEFARQGKGDHSVWKHPSGVEYSLDGADSKEMARGSWKTSSKVARNRAGQAAMKVIVEFENSSNAVCATSPDFPNVVGLGDDRDDALRRFLNALHGLIEYHTETGEPLDIPSDDRQIEVIAA